MSELRTAVGIVGAGPAGLTLGNLLRQRGIDCVVVDKFTRAQVYARARAGFIEWRNKLLLEELGVAERMLAEGIGHGVCEFRSFGRSHVLDYSALAGGRTHWVYPQHELVTDLADRYVAAGGDLREAAECLTVAEHETSPLVVCRDLRLRCELVVGADGFHGPVRGSFPAGAVHEHSIAYPWQWLALLVEAPPSSDHVIYAQHERGYAAHMMRSPTLSRYYLQCARGDTIADWPDDRVWLELHTRLGLEGSALVEGPIVDRGMLELRSVVYEPMRFGRVLLAGDAAHIITPCGGKGMNLALQDAVVAADVAERFLGGDEGALDDYSARRLPDVWRTQEFSHWMLHMLHNYDSEAGSSYLQGLQHARLRSLEEFPAFATHFALAYVGAEASAE